MRSLTQLLFLLAFLPSEASATTSADMTVDFTAPAPEADGAVVDAHVVYDHGSLASRLGASGGLVLVSEVFVETRPYTEVATLELSADRNYAHAARVSMGDLPEGYYSATLVLSVVVDGGTRPLGAVPFWFHRAQDRLEIITLGQYAQRQYPHATLAELNANLEPGDVPGERVDHTGRGAVRDRCGVNVNCVGEVGR